MAYGELNHWMVKRTMTSRKVKLVTPNTL